jgi:hypothetical protein
MKDEVVTARPKPQMLGLAVVSLVLGCAAPVFGLAGVLFSALGVACGHAAGRQVRKDPDLCGGRLALVGLIVGYTYLTITAAAVIYVFLPMLLEMIRIR